MLYRLGRFVYHHEEHNLYARRRPRWHRERIDPRPLLDEIQHRLKQPHAIPSSTVVPSPLQKLFPVNPPPASTFVRLQVQRLLVVVRTLRNHEDRHVVLRPVQCDAIRRRQETQVGEFQARFFEGFALGTVLERLAVLEMAAGERVRAAAVGSEALADDEGLCFGVDDEDADSDAWDLGRR